MKVSWIRADWQSPPGVVAGCTTRIGGASRGVYQSLNLGGYVGDDPADVAANRARFRNICNLPSEPRWLKQVHACHVARDPDAGTEADGAYTTSVDTVCVVTVADCLPVLFASGDGSEIAAAHAGWRGLAGGVLENTLAEFAAPARDVRAWFGPAISISAFEVGAEVREAFCTADDAAEACFRPNDRGRWQADLYTLARQRLNRAGVSDITGGGFCTHGEPGRFFSFRRDGQCGRMAAFIYRRGADG